MHRLFFLAAGLLTAGSLFAETQVTFEQIGTGRGDWDKPAWEFKNIHRPSKSDAALGATVTIAESRAQASCLAPNSLHNGVMPQQTRLRRDFFTFENGSAGGLIVMDLGKVIPVAEINSYSAHGPVGGTTWGEEFDGARGPQVYTLYGSAVKAPDATAPASQEWVKIAEVDTRPKQGPWGGRWGVNIRDDKGALLGKFRWLVWQIKRTDKPGTKPDYTNTWFAEFDVHAPETLAKAGDFVPAGTQLKEIVVAYKSHFDIGFTHPAPEIVNLYRTSMIDRALGLIDGSKNLPKEQRFAWTIPSWVLWQIIWPGQDPVRRARIITAVKEGSLVIHALPVTLQTESLDLEDLVAGLALHTKAAKELGVPLSRSGKMTDVPSHSWILPTLLKNAGIEFLQIGCNPTNERPDVPLLYDWEGPDGSRLLTMHTQGYGSDCEFGHGIYPPKDWPYEHWLAVFTACDNTPPPSENEVRSLFTETARNLPGVKIRLGKMEDFSDAIRAEQKAGAVIPVVHADMPDCWIHGMGTMPDMEELARKTRTELIAAGSLDTHLRAWGLPRPDIRNSLFTAYERSVMYGEHTWGGAKNLQGRNAYADKNFAQTTQTDGTCKWLQNTWNDHAGYMKKSAAITDKLIVREMAQLAAAVNIEGDRLVVFNPLPYKRDAIVGIPGRPGQRLLVKDLPPSGYKAIKLDPTDQTDQTDRTDRAVLENPFLKVTIDRAKGGIVSIVEKATGRELVDPAAKHAFGQYFYERFSRKQCDQYQVDCNHLDSVYGANGKACYGWNTRADLPGGPDYAVAFPAYTAMSVSKGAVAQSATLAAPAAGIIAAKVTTTVTLPENAAWLEITTRLDDKQPDYWPENGAVYFPVNAAKPQFRIGRLGGVADPAKDFVRGSNRTYGIVNNGAMIAGADGAGVGICPLDHGMMTFGDKGMNTIDPDYVPSTPVATVSLFNNLWTINFPYWISGTVESRVRVWATHDLKPASLIEPALEARQPVLAAIGSGPAGKLPASASGLAISRQGVRLTCFAPNRDGAGTVLRLWEQDGEAGEITVTLPAKCPFTEATPVNLRGEKIGKPVAIKKGKFSFKVAAYAPASFVLTPELTSATLPPGPPETVKLAETDLSSITQGWGTPQKDKSVGGSPLKIGGVDFKTGIGTHSPMNWELKLDGQGIEFTAEVGMQDLGENGKGSVEFIVLGDGRLLFRSGILRSGDPAKPIKLDLKGINTLILQVTDAGDSNSADHADWIDPQLIHSGAPLEK